MAKKFRASRQSRLVCSAEYRPSFTRQSPSSFLLSPDMLVLYETSLGYCLFKLTDSAKVQSADLWEEFETPERANKL